jgi:hypothetical protein
MNIRKLVKYFGFRYHPYRLRYITDYVIAFFAPLEYLVSAQRPEFFIVGCIISLVSPSLMFFVIVWALLSSYQDALNDSRKRKDHEIQQVVLFIQQRHFQSLKEALDREPELALEMYKNHSMNYWCKRYNNPEAQTIIVKAIQKI